VGPRAQRRAITVAIAVVAAATVARRSSPVAGPVADLPPRFIHFRVEADHADTVRNLRARLRPLRRKSDAAVRHGEHQRAAMTG